MGIPQFRRRFKSQPRAKINRTNRIILVLMTIMISSMLSFIYVESQLRVPLMNIASVRVKQMATQSINKALTEFISDDTQYDKLIDWKLDNNGKITGFMLNYSEHMKMTANTVKVVQNTLLDLQRRPESIPIGQALNSAFLASFGPHVPIKLVPAGSTNVHLQTRQHATGINMLLVEVYIQIGVEVSVIIPFHTKPELVQTEIPVSYVLVIGDVPMYYYDNQGNPASAATGATPPSIALPPIQPLN